MIMTGSSAACLFLLQLYGLHSLLVEASKVISPDLPPPSKPQKPRFAFMFIGRTMDFKTEKNFALPADLPGSRTIFDYMTGDDSGMGAPQIPDSGAFANTLASFDLSLVQRPWVSFLDHVIAPLAKDGFSTDIYVCSDNEPPGEKPSEVTAVFALKAANQWDRLHACYEKIKQQGEKYDFYVRTRPDFLHMANVSLQNLRVDRLHSRFRSAWNIEGLKGFMFSVMFCAKECHMDGGHNEGETGGGRTGYMLDDQFFVAHEDLWSRIAIPHGRLSELAIEFDKASGFAHDKWIPMGGFSEGAYTKALLQQGVLAEPLEVIAVPLISTVPWYALAKMNCNFTSNAIERCGSAKRSVEDVNSVWLQQ